MYDYKNELSIHNQVMALIYNKYPTVNYYEDKLSDFEELKNI